MAAPINMMAPIANPSNGGFQPFMPIQNTTAIGNTVTSVPSQLLDKIWTAMNMQFTPFNVAWVVSVPGTTYHILDAPARDIILKRFERYTGFTGRFIRDGTHIERWLLGPVDIFKGQIKNKKEIEVFIPRHAEEPESPSETGTKKPRIRRPPNAYILYRKDHHEAIKEAHPGIHNNQISMIIGAKWRHESNDIKAKYQSRAIQLRNDLLKLFPHYKYQPRKPGEKKKRAKRGAIAQGEIVAVGNLDSDDMAQLEEVRKSDLDGASEATAMAAIINAPNIIFSKANIATENAQAHDAEDFNDGQAMHEDKVMAEDGANSSLATNAETDQDDDEAIRAFLDEEISN